MNQKLLLFGIIVLVLVGAGSYILGTNKNKASIDSSTKTLQCKTDNDCQDNNVCTDDICTKGVCSNPNSIDGKSCGANLPDVGTTNFCDGAGKCVYRGPIQPGPLEDPETANWKSYTTLDYSVRYPSEFKTTISDSTSNITDKTGAFNLSISTESTNLDLNNYIGQKSQCATINSKNGTPYRIDSENSLRFEETLCGQTGSTHIYTIHNGTAYHFSIATQAEYKDYLTTLNNILSTFQFSN